jgi:hypothetical protein
MKAKMFCVSILLVLGGVASAQEALLDYVVASCQADLDKYCADVSPGQGRLMYCVAAHQDKISDKCEGALIDAAMILSDLTDRIVDVAESCGPELNKFCGDVEVGEGRVLACLDEHEDELSKACEATVDELVD